MIKPVLVIVCVVMAAGLKVKGTNLTPIKATRMMEESTFEITKFKSVKGEEVEYTPPWPLLGGGDSVSFKFPAELAFTKGGIKIHRGLKVEDIPLTDNPQLRQWLELKLPKESKNCVIDSISINSLRINGNSTAAIKYTYEYAGRSLSCATILCWRLIDGVELFEFTLETTKADFNKLFRELEVSLFSIGKF